MSKRIHVHSWPIDRAFTFEEWCDYLKAHEDDSDQAVAEFGGWKFNVHGACLNKKEVFREYIGRTGAKFEVDVYQAPRGEKLDEPLVWNFSAYYTDGISGGTAGRGEVNGNEDDAVIAGLEAVIRQFKKLIEWNGNRAEYKSRNEHSREAIQRARELINDRRQLTLF